MDPRLLIHPGEILKEEFLVPFGLSANRVAKAIGVPTNQITEIVNGTRGITGETAVLFAHAFGTTPEFWLNLQSRYELDLASTSTSGGNSACGCIPQGPTSGVIAPQLFYRSVHYTYFTQLLCACLPCGWSGICDQAL